MPLSRLAMTAAASMKFVLAWGAPATACRPGGAPGVAGATTTGAADGWAALAAGSTLSVSRRISFTLTTIDSQSLFSEATSTWAVAPVLAPVVVAAPVAEFDEANWVEASELIFTLRAALR